MKSQPLNLPKGRVLRRARVYFDHFAHEERILICLCGHTYVRDDQGKDICPHCIPTQKGFKAVGWAADDVFGRKRALLFTNRDKAEILVEVLRDNTWTLEGVVHPSPGKGAIEFERVARANALAIMQPTLR